MTVDDDRSGTRIGIIGAGPGGLCAAHFLRKAGYARVTVLEAGGRVAGKSGTVEVDGRRYDVGAVCISPCYRAVAALAAEFGVEPARFRGRILDFDTGRYLETRPDNDMIALYASLMPRIQDYYDKREAAFRGVDCAGHGPVSEVELAAPIRQWLRDRDMEYVGDCWYLAYTSAGYGYLDDDIPAAYFLKFIETCQGKIEVFANGFQELWDKMSEGMDIRFNQRAVRIRRPSTEGKPGPITVTAADGTGTTTAYEFDRLVFACGPRSTVSALGPAITEVERGLFSEFRSVDYYTLVVSAADLPTETSLTVIPKHCVSRETGAGHIVGIFCSHPGVGTYIVYAYGAAGLSPEDVARTVREDIAKMGGTMTELHFQERWEYMPHVTPLAMSRGFFSAFESIQGLHGCYHTGGLMDFEETEQCAKYGKNLVERFFPAPGAEPAVLAAAANLPPGVSREAAAEVAKFGINRWVRRGSVGLDPDVRNWAAVMHRAAMRYPQKVAFTWLNGNLKEVSKLTYGEMDVRARRVARYLREVAGSRAGERVLLCFGPGISFLPAMFGVLAAGCVAVPLAPPDPRTLARDVRRFARIAADTGARVVLCERDYVVATTLRGAAARLTGGGSVGWPENLRWVACESVVGNGSPAAPEGCGRDIDPDDLAFIQYSSGSTGDPKGVALGHGQLLKNVAALNAECDLPPDKTIVFWVPQFHDLGLVGGFLNVIRANASAAVFSPLTFLQKPIVWLQAMSRYKATYTAAPNFAYELCGRRLRPSDLAGLDLSHLEGAFAGAEPVRRATIERFCRLTAGAGFDPGAFRNLYGLAETCAFGFGFTTRHRGFPSCVLVDEAELRRGGRVRVVRRLAPYPEESVTGPELAGPDPKGLILGTGYPNAEQNVEVRIVDPETRNLRPHLTVGEIWLSSPSVGSGYWARDEENESTFRATLAGTGQDGCFWTAKEPERTTFLRTGDLGFYYDGEVYIAGRQKDLIIINGKNHYPHDIEITAQEASPHIRPGCVIAAPANAGGCSGSAAEEPAEKLTLLCELRASARPEHYGAIREEVACAVAATHGILPERLVFLAARALPKTTSGKVQRSKAAAMLGGGEFGAAVLYDDQGAGRKQEVEKAAAEAESRKLVGRSAATATATTTTATTTTIRPAGHLPAARIPGQKDIQACVAEFLRGVARPGVVPEGEPDVTANVMETYALDSLSAVQVIAQLQAHYGVEIGVATLFNEPTIEGVAKQIGLQLAEKARPADAAAESGPPECSTDPDGQDAEEELVTSGCTGLGRAEARGKFASSETADAAQDAPPPAAKAEQRTPAAASSKSSAFDRSPLVTLVPRTNASGDRPSLVCVHPLLGSVACYLPLVQQLGPDQPVYGLEAAAFRPAFGGERGAKGGSGDGGGDGDGAEDHEGSIELLSEAYASTLAESQPTGDFVLLGYSFGGLVAYGMARELERRSRRVLAVVLVDAPAPLLEPRRVSAAALEANAQKILADGETAWMTQGHRSGDGAQGRVARRIGAMREHVLDVGEAGARDGFAVHQFRAASAAPEEERYGLLLDHPHFHGRGFGWERYSGRIVFERSIPGNHFTVMRPENVRVWGRELRRVVSSYGSSAARRGSSPVRCSGPSSSTTTATTTSTSFPSYSARPPPLREEEKAARRDGRRGPWWWSGRRRWRFWGGMTAQKSTLQGASRLALCAAAGACVGAAVATTFG